MKIQNPELAEQFIVGVMKKYSHILDRMASKAVRSIGDQSICKEDIIQEMYIYMLKYNFPKVEELSKGEMWYPFIIGSATNCISNMIKKRQTNKRRRFEISLDEMIENTTLPVEKFPSSVDVSKVIDAMNKMESGLNINERRLLSLLLNKKKKRIICKLTLKKMAEMLYLPSSTISKMIKDIELKLKNQLIY